MRRRQEGLADGIEGLPKLLNGPANGRKRKEIRAASGCKT